MEDTTDMRRRLAILAAAAVAAGAGLFVAPTAHADGFCYDVNVNVAGTEVVNQVGCQEAPALPGLPTVP
jgi:hypothetical protein